MTSHRSAAATRLPSQPVDYVDPTADLPEVYAMQCEGDCMAPEIASGSYLAVWRTEPYETGDLVIVWLRPEFVKPGGYQCLVKRIALNAPPWVKGFPYSESPGTADCAAMMGLSMNSMPGKLLMIECAHIAAIHLVVGVRQPGRKGGYYPFGRLRTDADVNDRLWRLFGHNTKTVLA